MSCVLFRRLIFVFAVACMAKLGKIMKARREQLGIELSEIADILKIREKYLRALEDNVVEDLPQPVYTIGYIKNYAYLLGLNIDKLLTLYKQSEEFVAESKNKRVFVNDEVPDAEFFVVLSVVATLAYKFWLYYHPM